MKKLMRTGAVLLLAAVTVLALSVIGCDSGNDAPSNPAITGFGFTQTVGLRAGTANTANTAVAGVFANPEGGTGTFTYSLVTGDGDTDNGKFVVDGTNLKIGAALVQGNASVRIQAKDIKGEIFSKTFSVSVLEAEGAFPATPAEDREMITVIPGGESATITGSGTSGVFIEGRTVTLGSYSIAKYETTWQLWKEVYDWATSNDRGADKYTFANPGIEGHGYDGTGMGTLASLMKRPVTMVNQSDAFAWCNAYSEKEGLVPVYYNSDDTIFRVSASDRSARPVMKRENTGYRLPIEAEWEFAARGGDPDAPAWSYSFAGSNTVGDVAWYQVNASNVGKSDPNYGVHPIGTKTANDLGIHDMTGNVNEWCWDFHGGIGSGTPVDGQDTSLFNVIRGGGWTMAEASIGVFRYRLNSGSGTTSPTNGFRVAQSLQ